MAQPYVGQITIFAGQYAPAGYVFCNGQSLSINEYQMLYSLIGTTYGGDGRTTFNVPDLRGRVPVGMGIATGGGTINWAVGASIGTETVTLTTAQMPAHSHTLKAVNQPANSTAPLNNLLAADVGGIDDFSYATPTSTSAIKPFLQSAVSSVGGWQGGTLPHDNVAPYMALNYIIATQGLYPEKNN
jgi:microcystin-dependent protein